ncbi:homoprotocatechuate degradation operon regulator HpaR [Rhodopseudomonas sp.]|uniref:homoprotocatechuate degradation operon regulator HpaR n=1 Tax=Rhodopseudomonas sp. TaxID=1078 RepID=UPI0039E2427E
MFDNAMLGFRLDFHPCAGADKPLARKLINMLNDAAQIQTVLVAMQKTPPPSLRAKRSNPATRRKAGLPRREAPRHDGNRQAQTNDPPMREFSRSLPMLLLRGREAVMRHFRPLLRAHGLSEQQWRILRALTAVESLEVTELAERAFLLGPSLSRMLRDLEARKLVARKPAKDDQRRSMMSITAKGLKLIETVAPFSEAIYAEITRRTGGDRLAELQDLLRELEASLVAMPVHHAGSAVDSEAEFRSTRAPKKRPRPKFAARGGDDE